MRTGNQEFGYARHRVTLFAGHYGSGKTNLALNFALRLRSSGEEVALADLDIVNPYFRTRDSAAELAAAGVRLVVSEFASSNVDLPAMPSETYALVADRGLRVVMDIGGDDRGALALGRYVPDLRAEGDYDFLAVINASRPLTRNAADTVEVLREIEAASGLGFTGIVNNTNLGPDTTPETVIASLPYAEEVAAAMGLEVRFTAASAPLAAQLAGRVKAVFPLSLQRLCYHFTPDASAADASHLV